MPQVDRRTFLRLSGAGVAGIALTQLPAYRALGHSGTYNLFAGATSRPADGSFISTTYLQSTRGGLWNHTAGATSVETGSSTKPFHSGDWYANVARVRVESKIGFHQPLALVVQGKILGLDPNAGQTIGGVKRTVNPGLKVHVGFANSNENYVISLMTQNKKIRIALNSSTVPGSYLNYDQDVGIVPPTFNWALNTTYCFKVEWVGHDIAVYHRNHSDPNNGSNDVLLHQTTGNWANRYNSLTNPPKVGFYLDGTAVRMYDYHIWQGPH